MTKPILNPYSNDKPFQHFPIGFPLQKVDELTLNPV